MASKLMVCLVLALLNIVHDVVGDQCQSETCDEAVCKPPTEAGPVGANDCGMTGMWKNELSSCMYITNCWKGQLDGYYSSKVGQAVNWYPLSGRYTVTSGENREPSVEVGWTVSWINEVRNSNSVTTWSGIYYIDNSTIYTQWILTRYQDRKNLWQSAMINSDVFTPYNS